MSGREGAPTADWLRGIGYIVVFLACLFVVGVLVRGL